MKIAGTPVIVFTLYEKKIIVGVALILKGNYFVVHGFSFLLYWILSASLAANFGARIAKEMMSVMMVMVVVVWVHCGKILDPRSHSSTEISLIIFMK